MASNFTTGIPFTTISTTNGTTGIPFTTGITTNFTTANSTLLQTGSSTVFISIVSGGLVSVVLLVLVAAYCVVRARKTKPEEKKNTDQVDNFPSAATFDTFDVEASNLSYSEAKRTSGTDSVSSRRKRHEKESLGGSRDSLHRASRDYSPHVSGKQNRSNRGSRQEIRDDLSVASSAYSNVSRRGRKLQLAEASASTQAYRESSGAMAETTIQSLRPTGTGEGRDNDGYEPESSGGLGPMFVSASDYRKQQWERADSEDSLERPRNKRKRRTKNADRDS